MENIPDKIENPESIQIPNIFVIPEMSAFPDIKIEHILPPTIDLILPPIIFVTPDLTKKDNMTEPRNMGIGALGMRDNTFVRQFRFVICGQHLSESFNHSLKINWTKQRLKIRRIEVIQDKKNSIWDWIDAMQNNEYPEETLQFITYDGSGNELYCKQFEGLKIQNVKSKFNYSVNEVSLPEITISYEKVTNQPLTTRHHETLEKEAAEINFLNAKTWVN